MLCDQEQQEGIRKKRTTRERESVFGEKKEERRGGASPSKPDPQGHIPDGI